MLNKNNFLPIFDSKYCSTPFGCYAVTNSHMFPPNWKGQCDINLLNLGVLKECQCWAISFWQNLHTTILFLFYTYVTTFWCTCNTVWLRSVSCWGWDLWPGISNVKVYEIYYCCCSYPEFMRLKDLLVTVATQIPLSDEPCYKKLLFWSKL